MLRGVVILGSALALIAVLVVILLLIQGSNRIKSVDMELIRPGCARNSVIAEPDRGEATKIRTLLASGAIDRWRDLSFRSGRHNEGIYIPHPDAKLNRAGVRINVIDVHLHGDRIFEMRMPTILVPPPLISISAPEHVYLGCQDLLKNDFVDYL